MRPDSPQNDRLSALFEARWDHPESLLAWAKAAGIEPELDDPAMLALVGQEDESLAAGLRNALTTVEELAAPSPEELSSLRVRLGPRSLAEAQEAARAYLDQKALAKLGLASTPAACEARWAEAPVDDPVLGPWLLRLRKLRLEGTLRGPIRRARLERWTFQDEPARVQVQVDVDGSNPWRPSASQSVIVKLSGAPEPWCSCRAYGCPHIGPALDAILEGVLDPSCSFAADLRRTLNAPEWQRALGRLDAALARLTAGASAEEPETRIAWKITPTRSVFPEVTPLLQKRLKSGKYSGGTPVRYYEHTAHEVADPRELARMRLLQTQGGWLPEHQREAVVRQVLRDLCGHPHVYLAGAGQPLRRLDLRAATLQLSLAEAGGGSLALVPWIDGAPAPLDVLLPQVRARSFDGTAVLLDTEAARCLVAQVDPKAREVILALAEATSFPPEAAPELLERAARIASLAPMRIPENLLGDEVPARDDAVIRVERTGPVSLRLQILVAPAPGGAALVPGQGVDTAPGVLDGRRIFARRSFTAEVATARTAQRTLDLDDSGEGFSWAFSGDAALDLLVRLGGLGDALRVEWLSDRWKVTQAARGANVSIRLASKRDWLGLDGKIEIEGVQLELAEALDAARRGARYVKAGADTWVALSDELRERLSLAADQTFSGRGGLEASLASLPALAALGAGGGEFEAALELRKMLERIRTAAKLEPEVPQGLSAELRPYQTDGYRWLARLAAWGGGGCLADDMGLGKTVQALALLVHRMDEGPALVLAPTSVCGNWVREAQRFAPDLRPLVFGEGDRAEVVEGLGPRDVLIVSYTFLARERELLTSKRFATLVLAEAQAIKNPQTERAKAARALQADVRIALSGTPLENHVGELWSLFQVAVPGLLGSWEQFRQRFGLPIERDGDVERKLALSRVLRPFLLRRTKQEVATELPERTEIDDFVELSREERELYEQARLAAVARVKGVAGSMPPEKARFEVLAAITRLRLASCHPALYDPDSIVESSKLERAIELLVQLREEGHRALVFSQFTKHLGLVRDAAEKAGLNVLYLDGQTPGGKRQELVDAFQAGEADHFFISLKAGGSGLNLTAADFVLHLDPWWNPAVEDQASDRAHRIGQTRPVTVIRLIARKTIEEQILSLHAQKRDLVASILDGSDRAGALGTDDLIALIEGAALEA